jgi:tetratricopeptide (TPR) repeat protein
VAAAASPALAAPPQAAPPDPEAVLRQARARQALTEYADAADGLERFVALSPKAADAPDALQDAIVLRLGLGQEERAVQDAELFAKSYGATQRSKAALVWLALAYHDAEREEWAAVESRVTAWLRDYGESAPVDYQLRAHVLLGRALAKQNQAKKAEPEYAKARALWKDPAAAQQQLRADGGDDRRLGHALTMLGEAMFFGAEQKRREVDAIRFPEYKGKPTKDEVLKHMSTRVVDWVKRKRSAIEEAEKAYQEVLAIQPVPPPRWVIASASRVGQLWGRFVAEFRAAPIPREWKGHGVLPGTSVTADEIRRAYYEALDGASEPMKQQAKAAMKTCADYSVKFEYWDEHAQQCAHWLLRNYRTEYHEVDDVRPRPRLLGPATPPPDPLPDPR